MKLGSKDKFLNRSHQTLSKLYDMIQSLPSIELKTIDAKKSAFFIVDMVNGFTREGALKSPRVEDLIPSITALSKKCDALKIPKVAFADYHPDDSPEFSAYPVHCLADSHESEVVDEIKEAGGYDLILKNSTNGFLEDAFQKWLARYSQVNTFILAGDCTDICVQQLAITLKTWFTSNNQYSRIIVPFDLVDTYDLGVHNGDLMNIMAFYNMICNGVEVVKTIKYSL